MDTDSRSVGLSVGTLFYAFPCKVVVGWLDGVDGSREIKT